MANTSVTHEVQNYLCLAVCCDFSLYWICLHGLVQTSTYHCDYYHYYYLIIVVVITVLAWFVSHPRHRSMYILCLFIFRSICSVFSSVINSFDFHLFPEVVLEWFSHHCLCGECGGDHILRLSVTVLSFWVMIILNKAAKKDTVIQKPSAGKLQWLLSPE